VKEFNPLKKSNKKRRKEKEKENNTFDDTNLSLFDLKTSPLSYELPSYQHGGFMLNTILCREDGCLS
jgi:hypothetical protein